jgi:3-methyladenine DNA glycosylase AlkD
MSDLDPKYKQLIKQIQFYKNGALSDSMRSIGKGYELNYGLTIPLIDKIAANYDRENAFAFYCWNQHVRESRLIGIRLFEPGLLDEMAIRNIMERVVNVELAEQIALHLLCHFPDKLSLLVEYISNGTEFVRYSGIMSIFWILRKTDSLSEKQILYMLMNLDDIKWSSSNFIVRALAGLLIQIGIRGEGLEREVVHLVKKQKNSNSEIARSLELEVINFFKSKNEVL